LVINYFFYIYFSSWNRILKNRLIEYINTNWFISIEDAQDKLEAWMVDYNEYRPHSSLDNMTLAEFVGQLSKGSNEPDTNIMGGLVLGEPS
jgi:transposase InsO family protein